MINLTQNRSLKLPKQQRSLKQKLKLHKLRKTTDKINNLQEKFQSLSDQELSEQTLVFKQRLKQGESLDDLMLEAFATVREASRRVLGQFPHDVQVMGAIALHQGYIAEMKTGEGKTLTATMPLYLNALSEKGAILVTTNDYLASRDAEEMGKIYQFLGMTVGVGVFDEEEDVDVKLKRAVYSADITYITAATLGFDYLADNLVGHAKDKFLRPYHYAIIDEADAVLLDNAQTPLVISGSPRVQSNLFESADAFVRNLKKDKEYYLNQDDKEVFLTDEGIDYAQSYFAISDLFDNQYWELNRVINLALRAHHLFRNGYDYVVHDDDVKLLDRRTGRLLEGTRLQAGIHQAIECKEKVKLTKESRAIGSVTYQSLFNMFPKLAGMTGTALMSQEELIAIYRLPVVSIPTHLPIIRTDYPDLIYTTLPEKLYATIELVKKLHLKKQPVLLISGSVEVTDIYSKILLKEGIAHNTLTANNIAKEAMIIQEAGQLGAVTCATILAGRGTDIKLGQGVVELGGLAVIGTERMINSRMDWQLRGRSGRQGEPGMSQFFVSLEDELLTEYGPKWLKRYFHKHHQKMTKSYGQPLLSHRFKRALKQAQEHSEDKAVQSRQSTMIFDESLRVQRQLVYQLRDSLIFSEGDVSDKVKAIYTQVVKSYLDNTPFIDETKLRRYILDHYSYHFRAFPEQLDVTNKAALVKYFESLYHSELSKKIEILNSVDGLAEFYRLSVLKAIDECWVEQVDSLQQLKGIVTTRTVAQRDSIAEYYKESLKSYEEMAKQVRERIVRNMMLSTIEVDKNGKTNIFFV